MSESTKNTSTPKVTALQDLIAGGLAGSFSVVVGHPFDTYKVLLQTSSPLKPNTALSAAASNASVSTAPASSKPSFNITKLYRGMLAPLASAGVVNALIFSSFGESSRLWDDYFSKDINTNDKNNNITFINSTDTNTRNVLEHETLGDLSWTKPFICGSFAGAVQAVVICPVEHIKCRLQTQSHVRSPNNMFLKGPFDAFDKILSSQGINGLFRGFGCTCIREIPAFGLYFSTYDFVKESVSNVLSSTTLQEGGLLKDKNNPTTDFSHTWFASSLAGGFSGALTWFVVYPFDVVKTKIQTLPLETKPKDRTIMHIYRQILEQNGWRFFFRGLGVTLMRAFPVNAIVFPVYEYALLQLTENNLGGTNRAPLANIS